MKFSSQSAVHVRFSTMARVGLLFQGIVGCYLKINLLKQEYEMMLQGFAPSDKDMPKTLQNHVYSV